MILDEVKELKKVRRQRGDKYKISRPLEFVDFIHKNVQ